MKLAPIDLWRANEGARKDFNAAINSPPFRAAIAFALADYQRGCAHLTDGSSMLKGANGIVDRLMNMGEPKSTRKPIAFNLPVQEDILIKHR